MSINFYNENAENFFNDTVNASMKPTYDLFLRDMPSSGEILDLGCGSGRDSKFFIDKGYTVTAIDLSKELAKKASKYIGQDVIVMDMKDIDYYDKFVGIWACASLLHLSENDILETLKKSFTALKNKGILYASFKLGEKNYEKNGRIFTCFNEEKFEKLILEFRNYRLLTFETEDVRENRKNEKWFNIILQKGA